MQICFTISGGSNALWGHSHSLFLQTGTLTEGNLDLAGVCESKNAVFQETQADPTQLPLDSHLVQAMATCHSLIKLNGELTGNPLDVKLFQSIEWVQHKRIFTCSLVYFKTFR